MGNKLGIPLGFSAVVILSLTAEALADQSAGAATPQPSPTADTTETPLNSYSPFTPYGRQYALMREELARYRALSEGDQWQPLPEGQTLAPGARDARVKVLRGLLMQYGDLSLGDDMARAALSADKTTGEKKDKSNAELFDSKVRQAVERFQRRHGLRADGIVDRTTREYLNTPPARRLATLEANLRRWQRMPKDLGPRYILVNIPEYTLRLMEGEQEQYRMRVVVGQAKHPTPQLSTRMTQVVFNPTWTVPRNIAVRELLPKGSANLSAGGYRLVNNRGKSVPFSGGNLRALRLGGVTLQQRGGEGNALGRFKFIIPNQQAIFLHDTQRKELFGRSQRAFSHGCVRLEKPLELAQIVLASQTSKPGKWNDERLTRYTSGTRTRAVTLERPIPVHIAYWTAWVDEEGLLNFRPDIYGRDSMDGDTPTDVSADLDSGDEEDPRAAEE
ncbi:L,D-transpeptidase family protein [Microbulbifer pacificus]|uniref:L,D-transpeptidase family protein n=1 Tax=Microbulbifer pacificus TaxID=407164 RepID=A0AAU0MWB0_9GAMM|nr:L,D-transpeptidase family protein [Microbulbifer pacificus]WOX04454.1 L,D-transpeptidase family protein [Microbulbifer pacificus]